MSECELVSSRIGEIISLDGETDQKLSSFANIPNDFFEDMESSWKGRVKRFHLVEAFEEVENAAKALSLAVSFILYLNLGVNKQAIHCHTWIIVFDYVANFLNIVRF